VSSSRIRVVLGADGHRGDGIARTIGTRRDTSETSGPRKHPRRGARSLSGWRGGERRWGPWSPGDGLWSEWGPRLCAASPRNRKGSMARGGLSLARDHSWRLRRARTDVRGARFLGSCAVVVGAGDVRLGTARAADRHGAGARPMARVLLARGRDGRVNEAQPEPDRAAHVLDIIRPARGHVANG
jgi:hypothetical protein